MTENEHNIFYQICQQRRLRVSPSGDTLTVLLELLASLSLDEMSAIFEIKKGLFKHIQRDAKRVADGDPFPSQLIDLICLIEAISTFKRPSDFMNRKYDGNFPNLAQSFLDGRRKKSGRKSKLEPLLKIRHQSDILKWRSQGHSFRAIAKALGKEPGTPEVSEASLRRVVKKWESEKQQEESHEHEP